MNKQLLMLETGLQIGGPIYGVKIEREGYLVFENDVRLFRFNLKIQNQKPVKISLRQFRIIGLTLSGA